MKSFIWFWTEISSFNYALDLSSMTILYVSLTFHSTSPLKMSLLAISTLFQATASFSSSRKSWASWLWLLQADTYTDNHTHTKRSKCQGCHAVARFTIISPLTRALRMTVSSSELSCSGSWTVSRCPWSRTFWIWLTGWQDIISNASYEWEPVQFLVPFLKLQAFTTCLTRKSFMLHFWRLSLILHILN